MLLAGLLLLVVNRVTRPIAKLAAAADAVGRGDYSVHVPAKGKDEVAQLTARFNQMTDEVQEHVEQLRDEAARKLYVAILEIIEPPKVKVADGQIPPEDPLVATYRRRLSSVVLS
mgnify:CR=1 FL=1